MTHLQSRINDYFAAEENRLAWLKIFCAANNLIDYAASEKIAKAHNDCAANGFYLSTDEAQRRFMMAHRYGIEDLDLGCAYFWDLFWFIVEKRKYLMDISRITYDDKGRIKNWFSNMLPLDKPFVYDGITYRTSENFYQAMKLPKDRNDLRAEIASMNPFKAKTSIRDKKKYLWRSDWDKELSLKVMHYILWVKFAYGTTWADKLLATGDEQIVEYNNWNDTFWGWDINKKTGENNLGKILMEIRKSLFDDLALGAPPK